MNMLMKIPGNRYINALSNILKLKHRISRELYVRGQ